MNEEYDPNKEGSYIIPFNANNLYGNPMSQPFQCGEYEWINPADLALEFIKQYDFETSETAHFRG